jgi:hypothetical protein
MRKNVEKIAAKLRIRLAQHEERLAVLSGHFSHTRDVLHDAQTAADESREILERVRIRLSAVQR